MNLVPLLIGYLLWKNHTGGGGPAWPSTKSPPPSHPRAVPHPAAAKKSPKAAALHAAKSKLPHIPKIPHIP